MSPVLLNPATRDLPGYDALPQSKTNLLPRVGWPAWSRDETRTQVGMFAGSPEWVFTPADGLASTPRKWLPFAGVLSGSARDGFTLGGNFPESGPGAITSDCVFLGSPVGCAPPAGKFSGRPDDPFTEPEPLEITILRTETTWTRFVPATTQKRPHLPLIHHGH